MNLSLVQKPILVVAALFVFVATAEENVNVTIRRAPYDVPNVSSKSEIAHRPCEFCGSSVSYERKYRWDTVRHEWIETTDTDASKVPTACRKCKQKEGEQAKLDQRERELDRRIEVEKTKSRISSKERKLKRLRNANR